MKLGNAELEPASTGGLQSTLLGREKFVSLIGHYHRPSVEDLLRLYNDADLPKDSPGLINEVYRIYLTTLFLHHLTTDQQDYLAEHGMGPNVCYTPVVELFRYLISDECGFSEELQKCRAERGKVSSGFANYMSCSRAIRHLIPSLNAVSEINQLSGFKRLVVEWSDRWHLSDEWCRELALGAIRSFVSKIFQMDRLCDGDLVDRVRWLNIEQYRSECVSSAWNDAGGEIGRTAFTELLKALPGIPENPDFHFHWGPLYQGDDRSFHIRDRFTGYTSEKSEFKRRVEQDFWFKFFDLYGPSQGVLTGHLEVVKDRFAAFLKKIDKYLKKCGPVQANHGMPRKEKRSGDAHFRWAVLFQVAGLSVSEIIRIEGENVTEPSLRSGIKDVAQLIGLTLRTSSPGRPKGRKDTAGHLRHRVTK